MVEGGLLAIAWLRYSDVPQSFVVAQRGSLEHGGNRENGSKRLGEEEESKWSGRETILEREETMKRRGVDERV